MAEAPNWFIGVLAAGVIVAILLGAGILSYSGSKLQGAAVSTTVQGGIASVGSGNCPTATNLDDLYAYAQESIINAATKAKTGIMATWNIYYPDRVAPTYSGTSASTGASKVASVPCGAHGLIAIVNGTSSYYIKQVLLPDIPYAPQFALNDVDVDKISTATLYGYNNTATGTQASSTVSQTLAGASSISDLKIRLKVDTGTVFYDPAACFKFTDATSASAFANVSSMTVSGQGMSPSSIPASSGGAATDGYHYCFALNVDGGVVKDNGFVEFYPVVTTNTNFGQINMTVKVLDKAPYTQSKLPVFFNGYYNEGSSSFADVGATNPTFIVKFNN